jgi:mannitol 2-dehydrogenase
MLFYLRHVSKVKSKTTFRWQKQTKMWDCVGMSDAAPPERLSQRFLAAAHAGPVDPGSPASRGAARTARLPTYDRHRLRGGITHLGVGGFHRAHLAVYVDDLAEAGNSDWSIVGSGVMPHDARMADVLRAQDCLYLVAEREGERVDGRIVASMTDVIDGHADPQRLIQHLSAPETRIVSLTITESGYPVVDGSFVPDDSLAKDITAPQPRSTFGVVTTALEARRRAGLAPFTVMSCDNLPGNGNVVRTAVMGSASILSADLHRWLEDHGAFPNAMVDRITPQTTPTDIEWAQKEFGFVDAWPVVCEPFRQWALEDHFVDGRPTFEDVGVLMTSDVIPYEHMKLRLLNGSHSGLAYHAALAGFRFVHDAVLDPRIERFIRAFMRFEAAPNLVAPTGINLNEYQDSLVQRFSNPAIADTVARLCMDGTSKFPTFLVPSVEAQLASGGSIEMLSLILAGWCRYLRGIADDGTELTLSHDPFLPDAIDAARESTADPRAFLAYERGLGPNLAQSDRLLARFSAALADLDEYGSLKTIDLWTSRSEPPRHA